jgi:hypothetical protein
MSITHEIEPYETVDLPDAGISVYQDGDEETSVHVEDDGMVRLGYTSGHWQIKVLKEATA